MLHRRVVAMSLVLLAGCDSGKSPPAPSSDASSLVPAKSCDAALALERRLAPIDGDAVRTPVDARIALPESKEGSRAPQAPVINFEVRRFSVDGEIAATPADVATLIDRRISTAEQFGREPPRHVLFAIAQNDQDLARVPEIAKMLGSKLEIQMLASPPGAKHEPVPAALERELTNVDASQRASILAQAMQKSIADCKPARDLFQSLATEPASGKGSSFKEKLPVAVAACDCKVGAELTDLAAYLLGGDRVTVAKRLVSSNDGSAKKISLKGLNGQALYDALPADGAPVRFEL